MKDREREMKVFEKAKQEETREAYISSRSSARKYNDAVLAEMRNYIMGDDCVKDLTRLQQGDYFLDPPEYRLVSKNFNNRKRAVYYFSGNQGYLIKLLMFCLRDLESSFSDHLYSFRSDKSGKDLLLKLRGDPDLKNYYIVKADVSNYVGSIVPEKILPMLEKFFSDDPDFFSFLEWLLLRKKCIDRNGNVIDHNPGGMGGVALSNFFMNTYLSELDDYFGPRCPVYARYSDDFLICALSEGEAEEYRSVLLETIRKLELSVNPEKTEIIQPGGKLEVLGMQISRGKMGISEHARKKIKRKIRIRTKKVLRKVGSGLLTPEEGAADLIEFYEYFFFGNRIGKNLSWARWSFPVLTDTDCLKELDHYMQDSLRYILYGSMKKKRMSVPYQKLHDLGYRTLMYAFYHPDEFRIRK